MGRFVRVRLDERPDAAGAMLSLVLDAHCADVASALRLGRRMGELISTTTAPLVDQWEALATIGATDLGFVRAIEPHLDAIGILAQARLAGLVTVPEEDGREASWGVFAAEGGADPLRASRNSSGWSLTGTKPWCSLADRLDRALVTAHLPEGGRGLFAVDLSDRRAEVVPGAWHARGLAEIPSGPVHFVGAPAQPIGDADWYLTRPGFAWGGIGVAACWYGGAVGIARTVFAGIGANPPPLLAMQLGQVDGMLQSARRALAEAASVIDSGSAADGPVLAKRVRASVAAACEGVLLRSGHALGPAPLALDAEHSKRVADLQLYIRQHHAEKDDASLGAALAASGVAPW